MYYYLPSVLTEGWTIWCSLGNKTQVILTASCRTIPLLDNVLVFGDKPPDLGQNDANFDLFEINGTYFSEKIMGTKANVHSG